MSANLYVLLGAPGQTLGAVAALVTVKFCVLLAVGWVQHRDFAAATRFACAISQGGEFAFVLFRLSVDNQVLTSALADKLVMVVTLSMAYLAFKNASHTCGWATRFALYADFDRRAMAVALGVDLQADTTEDHAFSTLGKPCNCETRKLDRHETYRTARL